MLNGEQVSAAMAIVKSFRDGSLTRASAIAMLTGFFGLPPAAVEKMVGPESQTLDPYSMRMRELMAIDYRRAAEADFKQGFRDSRWLIPDGANRGNLVKTNNQSN